MQQVMYDEKSESAQTRQVREHIAEHPEDFINAVVDAVPGIFYLLDVNAQFVMWNSYVRDTVVGKTEDEMASANALECIHPDDRLFLKNKMANIISTGLEDLVEVRVLARGGPEFWWYLLRGHRVIIDEAPYLIGLGSDITERKNSENHFQKLNRTLLALSRCNECILHAQTEAELLDTICHIIVEIGGYRMVWVGYAEQDEAKSIQPVAHAGFEQGYMEKLKVSWADVDRGRSPSGRAIRTGNPSLTRDILNDPQFEPWRKEAIKRGYASVQSFPLKAGNQVFGVITVYSASSDAFDTMETELLTTLAENLSYGITTLRTTREHKLVEESLLQSEKRYRTMFQNNHTVMLIIDPDNGMIIDANPAAATFYGWPIEKLRQMYIQEINTLPPEAITAAMGQSKFGEKNRFLFCHRRANGSVRDVDVCVNEVSIDGKELLFSIIYDVTQRKHYETITSFHISLILMATIYSIEELLQTSIDEAERLTESSIGFFYVMGEEETTISMEVCSTSTMKVMKMPLVTYLNNKVDKAGVWADTVQKKSAVIYNNYGAIKHSKGMPENHAEVRREVVVPVVRDDKVVAILEVGNKLIDYDADDVKWVGLIADLAWNIVAKKIAEDKQKLLETQNYFIENLALHDSLTGLPNRRFLSDRISLALGQCRRSKTMAALMIFDLDNFKIINDTFGHAIGDGLLQQVATRTLGTLLRSGDSIARLGGDEFVVLLPQITAISNAVASAEIIRHIINEVFDVDGHALNISCSFGIAVFPDHGQDELTLMKHADYAMYQSKRAGRNCITVYAGDVL